MHGQTTNADLPLPAGIDGVWDMGKAWKQVSPTRESICLNGLWRFSPVVESADMNLPAQGSGWGWFKVPGIWPNSDNFQVDPPAQDVLLPAATEARMKEKNRWFDRLYQAWYQREFVVPDNWSGRRILLDFTMMQSRGMVVINGKEAGEVLFPGGRLDVTDLVQPGKKQTVAVLLSARSLGDNEKTAFMGPDILVQGSGRPNIVGITGDVYLVSEPKTDAIRDVHVITSTRKKQITFDTCMPDLAAEQFVLAATVSHGGKVVRQFKSSVLSRADLKDGRVSFSASWEDPLLWDTDTPENIYQTTVTIADANGKLLDEFLPVKFGFREFWIDGRDFYLNGSRIHLRARMLKNSITMADKANLEGSRATCRLIKEYGYNFFIAANYGFAPGDVGYMDALFEAADESGILCSFSLPHSRAFDWLETPEQQARYKKLTDWLIRRAQNHPSIVMYAVNHNATGYSGDQNPLKMDGVYMPKDNQRRTQALVSVACINKLDPTRPVYNHHSGNLGDLFTVNIYLNWSPRQERSEWIEYWATHGTKPLFFVEWGPPHSASWSSFRGPGFIWYVPAFQQIWDSEFSSEYVGQEAFRMTPLKIKSLQVEEEAWATGKPFLFAPLRTTFVKQEENHAQIQSYMLNDNLRAFRTWGISALFSFDEETLWLRNKDSEPLPYAGKYQNLQRPGIVPDHLMPSRQYVYDSQPENFRESSVGKTFKRWNMPVACYIGGDAQRFTEKGHNFAPGDTIRKQLVLINDTRRSMTLGYSWRFAPTAGDKLAAGQHPSEWAEQGSVRIEPGQSAFIPVAIPLSTSVAAGEYTLSAKFDIGSGEQQEDAFGITVIPAKNQPGQSLKVALFDPKGMTTKLLNRLGIGFTGIGAGDSLDGYDVLIIGREAIALDNSLPSLDRVPEGMKVLVFEQSEEALQQRLGFRVQTRGIRNAFVRVPGHPALDGLSAANFADWRGAATLVQSHFDLPKEENTYPMVLWCGFENTRVWRNGNNENIASVVIEKPSKGNWLPVIDCGFDLQYSPLLEYSEGKGKVVFCQLDVTERTVGDPAADQLCRNLLSYLGTANSVPLRTAYYTGSAQGGELLERLGIVFTPYSGQPLDANSLLIAAPGCGTIAGLPEAMQKGMKLLALGLDEKEIKGLGIAVGPMKVGKTVPSLINDFSVAEFKGISNAELHARTLRLEMTAFVETSGSSNELLKSISVGAGGAVFCQTVPWMYDYTKTPYVRTTYRRSVFLVSRLLHNLGAPSAANLLCLWKEKTTGYAWPLNNVWKGAADKEGVGRDREWWKPEFDDGGWIPANVPGSYNADIKGLDRYVGKFWYRTRFTVPEHYRQHAPKLFIGRVDNESWVWLNGKFLGQVTKDPTAMFGNSSGIVREYKLDPGLLRPDGDNVLVVLVNNNQRFTGGILSHPAIVIDGAWLHSYYLQKPESEDDPYRYYRW
ncbi:MAG: beta galactosidase jelly roll domain-containing protein [Opitutaceae bacterium]